MQETVETNESLGTYLRRMREEKNISIEQVAYATRISLKMLRALEEDDHSSLPAPTFVRGYLQAYAKYVRIDTQDLLLRYQHHLATTPDTKKSAIKSHYLYVRERYQEKRRLVMVIILFAAMLSVAGTYFMLKAKRERNKQLAKTAEQIQKANENKIPSTIALDTAATSTSTSTATSTSVAVAAAKPASTATATQTQTQTTVAAAPAPTPAPAPVAALAEPAAPQPVNRSDEKKNYNLLLRADQDVWLRFQTDEDEVRDLTLRTGKAMTLRANKVIKIFSGNLGALKGTLNGQELASLSTGPKSKSAVLPQSEAPNYSLPLFPQFQTKSESSGNSGGSTTGTGSSNSSGSGNAQQ